MGQTHLSPGNRIVIRDAEWIVRSTGPAAGNGYVIEAIGLSHIVKDQTMLFLTSLEKNIRILKPEETKLMTDLSGEYAHSRLYIETLLRKAPPTGSALSIGLQGAMDNVPFQKDPAVIALKEPRCRILIADAVGLGKTIEAGILLTELINRDRGKRILVLALKSMLIQFQKELWSRFSIPLVRLDSAGIQRIRNHIPSNYNPFYYYDKIIISIDTIKREEEYRVWLENCSWDIIVIDEAHNVAERGSHSQRALLAQRLSYNCDSMIMLSATPHDGRKESFASLMNLLNPTAIADETRYGPEDIRGLFIRRFKKDIKNQVTSAFKLRKIIKHTVEATPGEEELFQILASMTFADKNRFGRGGKFLFKTVLEKALFSSPAACIETVENRLKRLEEKQDFAQQIKELNELSAFLTRLKQFSVKDYSKYHKLLEFLKSREYDWSPDNGEDRIVIFTERIKTMEFLKEQLEKDLKLKKNQIAAIYGDLPDVDLQKVVEDFGKEQSPIRILIASDIAAEGINLHYLCHRLIHFDIPWSLMVFQQRNGRIDRYGQEKEPLISYIITKSKNPKIHGDMRILELLIEKDQQVHENIGDPSEFTGCYDEITEETKTGCAMEQGMLPELFEKEMKSKDDFFDRLFSQMTREQQPEEDQPVECVHLYNDDFSYYTAVFDILKEKHPVQTSYNKSDTSMSITSPPGFHYREGLLPREIVPENEPYVFTANRKAIMKEIARCRKEEVAWPKLHLLWDMHPVMEWARDEIITLFGRHQAPVVHTPYIGPGETIYFVSGSYPNRKGHTILHACFGLLYRDGKYLQTFPLQDALKKTGISTNRIPNTNNEPQSCAGLEKLLGDVVQHAECHIKEIRQEFIKKADVKLKDQYERLKQLRFKRYQRLDTVLKITDGKITKRKKEQYKREKSTIDRIFDEYQRWIEDYMTIEQDPFIRIICVFTGV